ncbi:MAG: AraC family transcriptional regulator, glycine betaine-responsive activator [Rhodospirillaceae bacterium]|nr:AraC family transcriptional regulator, glycine betaine-responsive activator [Rhodospirillaceae bacterium]
MIGSSTHVSIVILPRFSMLALTAFIEPMRIANYLASKQLYRWDYRAAEPGLVTASDDLQIDCSALNEPGSPQPDIVMIVSGWGAEHYHSPILLNWLRRRERTGARLIGVEFGAYALARAGLLGGRRATTHWSCKAGFAEEFPNIEICEQRYTVDRNLMTCAGGTAGLDLMLHLISLEHGDHLAAEVATQIVYSPRPSEGAQRYAAVGIDEIHPDVRAAMSMLEARIEEPLSVSQLCRRLGVSQRQLERLFRRYAGCTIVQFSKLLRLQYARVLLTGTQMSIREVSASCGFNSLSYFSQCFLKAFSKKPSKYRRSWPEDEPTPSWPGIYSAIQASAAMTAGTRKRAGREPRQRPSGYQR